MPQHWSKIPPEDAADLELPHPDIIGPVNEQGEPCPWPWEPQQLKNVPLGQYHCPYCGAMVLAGVPHLDYAEIPFDGPTVEDPITVDAIRSLFVKLFRQGHVDYLPSSRYAMWEDSAAIRGRTTRESASLTDQEEDLIRYALGMGVQHVVEPKPKEMSDEG